MKEPNTYRLQDSLPVFDYGEACSELHTRRKSILVVEDEEDLNHALAARLRREGYHVVSTFDATTGLQETGFHRPDLVLLDLAEPGSDGLGSLTEFLRLERLQGVPVVAMGTLADGTAEAAAERFGVVALLEKPVNVEDLVVTLGELLGDG